MGHIEKRLETTTVFTCENFSLHHDRAQLEDGRIARREVIAAPDMAALFACDENGAVLLRRREYPSMGREEIVGLEGKILPGESPEAAAKKIAARQLGVAAPEIVFWGKGYPTPGILSETCYYYGLKNTASATESEKMVRYRADELNTMIADGALQDGRTLHLLALAAINGRLRGEAARDE